MARTGSRECRSPAWRLRRDDFEMTDDIGKQLTNAAVVKHVTSKHEIPELIGTDCKNAISTFKAVLTFETAMKVLPLTSDTA
jgi:hypothetical protein